VCDYVLLDVVYLVYIFGQRFNGIPCGGGSHEVFPLSSFIFSVSFVFRYLTWPRCRDPFFIFTIVMFRGGVGVTSHTPRIYFS
jgi:hypothetical protein